MLSDSVLVHTGYIGTGAILVLVSVPNPTQGFYIRGTK